MLPTESGPSPTRDKPKPKETPATPAAPAAPSSSGASSTPAAPVVSLPSWVTGTAAQEKVAPPKPVVEPIKTESAKRPALQPFLPAANSEEKREQSDGTLKQAPKRERPRDPRLGDDRFRKLTTIDPEVTAVGEIVRPGGVGANGVYYPPIVSTDAEATMERANQEAREKRRDTPFAKELTWDRYNALAPKQKAAVDFNTLLVGAREKDLRKDYDANEQQRATYDLAVQEMFGERSGSDIFAPETVAVLQQLDWKGANYKDGEGGDLDDFLELKVALTGKDVKDLRGIVKPDAPAYVPSDTITAAQSDLIEGSSNLEQKMAEAGTLLQNFQQSAMQDRGDALGWLGGDKNKIREGLGFGEMEMMTINEAGQVAPNLKDRGTYFQFAYDSLADEAQNKDGKLLGMVESELKGMGLLDEFRNYADYRSDPAARYDVPLGTREGVKYRSPEEFRKLLGLSEES